MRGVAGLAGLVLSLTLALAACEHADPDTTYPNRRVGGVPVYEDPNTRSTIFGPGGLFGSGGAEDTPGGQTGVGVNFFLWRASLDTISFMPLASADPFGGVIITDWYSDPKAPQERFKLTVYILSRDLRADGLRVALFRQEVDAMGSWHDTPVDPAVAVQLEDTILTRARQMRMASSGGG
jgi:hypothetical protein